MNTDKADVLARLMQWMADAEIDDADAILRDAITEIAGLRARLHELQLAVSQIAERDARRIPMAATLTDAEREAVEWFAAGDETCYGWGWKRRAETLRALLDRLSPIAACDNDRPEAIAADCPVADNAPKQDTTPAQGSVQPEWMNRPYWVDPPSGWAYGFPKLYDPATNGNMTEWMVANGYPQHLADRGLACTFTAT